MQKVCAAALFEEFARSGEQRILMHERREQRLCAHYNAENAVKAMQFAALDAHKAKRQQIKL
jgi:hypothetical protein